MPSRESSTLTITNEIETISEMDICDSNILTIILMKMKLILLMIWLIQQ